MIARIENRPIEQSVRAAGVPVVNVSAAGLAPDVPAVVSDSAALAGLAAEHFLERGFTNFGYCGDARFIWSAIHGHHFVARLRQAGFGCDVFPSTATDYTDWQREQQKLGCWLLSLNKPVAIMACYDIRGQQVLDVCRSLGLRVPDEIAVIGQHNDEVLCELCDPPLSSVIPNARLAGERAASLLDRMMKGHRVPPSPVLMAPLGVATRQSTDVIAIDDVDISAAMRFIREHAHQGIGVDDLLKAIPLSRSCLERKFHQWVGIAPYEAILRARVQRARELLALTDLSMVRIADMAGFSGAEYLSAAFKKQVGVSPRSYRERNRGSR
jgi:LacI family transcriptional regulator